MPTYAFSVTGRVQGVGFRYFVKSTADNLGLSGEVWNTRQGSVEGVAHGKEEDLATFKRLLSKGPGRVDSVTLQSLEISNQTDGFVIGRTR